MVLKYTHPTEGNDVLLERVTDVTDGGRVSTEVIKIFKGDGFKTGETFIYVQFKKWDDYELYYNFNDYYDYLVAVST